MIWKEKMNLLEEEIPSFYISKSSTKNYPLFQVDILDRRVEVHLEKVDTTEISNDAEEKLIKEPPDSEGVVESSGAEKLPVGTLMWATLSKYPYWPCIVASETEDDGKCLHVRFFGDHGRNGWVTHFFQFNGKDDFLAQKGSGKKFNVNYHYRKQWETAVKEAEEFLEYPIEKRLQSFRKLVEKQKKALLKEVRKKRKPPRNSPADGGDRKRLKLDEAEQGPWRGDLLPVFPLAMREKSTELSESGISTSGSISPCPTLDLGTITPIRVTPEPMVKVSKQLDIEAFFRLNQNQIHTELTLNLRKSHRNVCRFCGSSKGGMVKCTGRCGESFHHKCRIINVDLSNRPKFPVTGDQDWMEDSPSDGGDHMCPECSDDPKVCFVCGKSIAPDDGKQCMERSCMRSYHQECLKIWPQAKMSHAQKFTCPQHLCHICASDDPAGHQVDRKSKLLRCILCPSTYHSTPKCIPAGCEVLSGTRLICPKHWPLASKQINVNWCFICAQGGTLLCCDSCPIAVHEACANTTATEAASYICDDCESGRTLVYGDLVWAKQAHYRWWPAFIVTENCIPETLQNTPHNRGDIGTYFLGSHNWAWLPRKRMFLYQEDDGKGKSSNRLKGSFTKSLDEAKILCQVSRKMQQDDKSDVRVRMEPPPPYKRIKWNQFVAPVKMRDTLMQQDKLIEQCSCKNLMELDKCGAQSSCMNRYLQIECSDEICASGRECQNRRFTRCEYPATEIIRTQSRGWGLVTSEELHEGDFVIEYVGEILNSQQVEQRIKHKQETRNNVYYFLTLTNNLTIDAEHKGNVSRFINHSCDPNCMAQTWTVKGATRVGIFAIKDIPKGTELTFHVWAIVNQWTQ
ncbi:histone-lysine N-methyltransferase NSD2-like [Lutzomyia longipalpis]|uniref:histone-lysine N-methyltransferase NSD2-like n=1 Tax=Lutzomyia longipalpis TaxID=7200 RepID=UPI002483F7F3|nr:histone-lysine N-methyltransferase NSD2-like [Lutzomyia longipalpis]